MQGINKAKHAHLIDALLNFQQINNQNISDPVYVDQARIFSIELKRQYRKYEFLLQELAFQIEKYEELAATVKVQFLGKKLKELKKQSVLAQTNILV